MSHLRYTSEVGRKFNADGSAHPFPGNTVVCMAYPHQAAYQLAIAVQKRLRALPCADKYTFLPPDSLHMTVIELLCATIRTPERWSRHLPLDAPLEATDHFFIGALSTVRAPVSFTMAYAGLAQWPGIVITLQSADDQTASLVKAYRDAVAGASGVRLPNHEQYTFHITLSYLLAELEAEEQELVATCLAEADTLLRETFGTFETGSPTLSFFDDMWRFVPATERHTLQSRSY
jgi:hypothetical protein